MAKSKVDVLIKDDEIEDLTERDDGGGDGGGDKDGGKKPAAPKEKKVKEQKVKKEKKPKQEGGGGGKIAAVVVILLILALVGAAVAVVGFNALGLRDKYLAGVISKTPIINNIIKTDINETETPDPAALQAEIAALNGEIDDRDAEIERLRAANDAYLRELEPLKDMEREQLKFKAEKEEFDKKVAMGDTAGYERWYEEIYPDLAELLYKEAVGINVADKAVSDYMNKIKGQDAKKIAAALENLMTTNMSLVGRIFERFDQTTASEVLDAMKPQSVADIYRFLEPKGF